jgi:hypothetical protein
MANYPVKTYVATGIIAHCMSSRETADVEADCRDAVVC